MPPSRVVRFRSLVALGLAVLVLAAPMAAAQRPEATALARPRSVIAYVPYWDQERGFQTVVENADVVTEVSPWWYSVGADGRVDLQWPGATYVDLEQVRRAQAAGVRVVPVVANHRDGRWDHEAVAAVLHDPAVRAVHVASIVELVVSHGYDGIDIDYEDLRASDRAALTELLTLLADALHAHGRTLAVDVHAKTSHAGYDERNLAQDYAAIGQVADQVRLMAYDWHWSTSPPGPVAPIWWVDQVVRWAVTQIPPEKVVLGTALFGYDWVGHLGQPVTWSEVVDRHRFTGARVRWDTASQSPWLRFPAHGWLHEVWFENAYSFSEKLGVARAHGVGGVHLWRVGGEDPGVWDRIRREYPPRPAPADGTARASAPSATTTSTSTPGAAPVRCTGSDSTAEHFANARLEGVPSVVACVDGLAHDWGEGPLHPGLPADGTSVAWSSTTHVAVGGSHRIDVRAEGGVRVYLDGRRLVDAWHEAAASTTVVRQLAAGPHEVRVELVDRAGPASFAVTIAAAR